jgi:hypothetical protein
MRGRMSLRASRTCPVAVRQAEFFIRTERCAERSPRLANLEYVMRARISPVCHYCAEIHL